MAKSRKKNRQRFNNKPDSNDSIDDNCIKSKLNHDTYKCERELKPKVVFEKVKIQHPVIRSDQRCRKSSKSTLKRCDKSSADCAEPSTSTATHECKRNDKDNSLKHPKMKHFPKRTRRRPGPSHSKASRDDGQGACKSEADLEIPGFYFDKEKKKYFKILPGQNVNEGVITKETIIKKKIESSRLKDLEKLQIGFDAVMTYRLSQDLLASSHLGQRKRNSAVYQNVLQSLELEKTDSMIFNRTRKSNYLVSVPGRLKQIAKCKVFEGSYRVFDQLEHCTYMLPTQDGSQFLCVWSLKELLSRRMQLMDVEYIQNPAVYGKGTLKMKPAGELMQQHHSGIMHICWAPVNSQPNSHILMSLLGLLGQSVATVLLRKIDPNAEGLASQPFDIGRQAPWSCSWNPCFDMFSVGTEKASLLIDVRTRSKWELNTKDSDVLAQVFQPQTGMMLYSGTRRGVIVGHDLRSRSTWPVVTLNHTSCVSDMIFDQDPNYLIASDFKGKIKLWDLRMRRTVRKFKGHDNEYSRLPLHLDPSGSVLYSVGQDCYTRFWDHKSGELLQSIPCPHSASRDSIPATYFSSSIGRSPGHPGLLMASKDMMYFFGASG